MTSLVERSAVTDALTCCDMTTSPTGSNISLEERIADILHRYGDEDIVTQQYAKQHPFYLLILNVHSTCFTSMDSLMRQNLMPNLLFLVGAVLLHRSLVGPGPNVNDLCDVALDHSNTKRHLP